MHKVEVYGAIAPSGYPAANSIRRCRNAGASEMLFHPFQMIESWIRSLLHHFV